MLKENLKNLKEKIDYKVAVPLSALIISSPVFCYAEDGTAGTAKAVTGALKSTAEQITASLNAIAPIGLSIAGTFLVWRYGMKFFKSLSK